MPQMTIEVTGRPGVIRLAGRFDDLYAAAVVLDSAIKRCRDLWLPAEEHAVDPGAAADHARFEPAELLDSGRLASELIRAGADAGHTVDVVGLGDTGPAPEPTRLVVAQHALEPRRVAVQLSEAGTDRFSGRHDDFLGWAKG